MRFCNRAVWAFAVLAVCSLFQAPAYGFGHLWHLTEIYTSADGSVQFIEMHSTANGETFLSGATVKSNITGKIFTFPNDLSGNTFDKRLLLATPGFGSLPGAVQPDFTIPPNFFSLTGDRIAYDAFGPIDSVTFSAAQLPKNGVLSLDTETLQTGVNTPTNFSGATGSVNVVVPEASAAALAAGALLVCASRRRVRR